MKLYLSGATHLNSVQKDISKSLGGFISSTSVPNGQLNVLFGDVSIYGEENSTQETIAIFLKNDSKDEISNLILQQIYNNNLGVDDNLCKFEWAVVEPNEQGFIERIGNRSEIPFDADFFEPKARREDCILKIITPSQIGDVIEILGVEITNATNTKEGNVLEIVKAFENNNEFIVLPKNEDSIYIRRIEIIQTNNPVSITTNGTLTHQPTNFSGFLDNGYEISESLKPGEFIGLWIKRKITKKSNISVETLEKEYDEMFGIEFSEEVIQDFEDNEEDLEVIFSWN